MRKGAAQLFCGILTGILALGIAGAATVYADASATLETTLWTLNYDDSVWQYEEDKLRDSEKSSSVTMIIPEGEDDELVTVEIKADITSPYGFRDDLYSYGIDEREYVENNDSIPQAEIGGVSLLINEGTYWGSDSIRYFNRLESANETISVRVFGEITNENVQTFLDGLTFKVTDTGNVDGPWYWQGEPFSTENLSASVGDVSLQTSFLKMNEPYITHETFKECIAVIDSTVYVLCRNILRTYDMADGALTFNTEYDLGKDYSSMQNTSDGRLFISGFSRPLMEWKDGEIVNQWSGSEIKYVEMAPDGSFGISFFTTGSDCSKLVLNSDGTYEASPIAFDACGTIMHLNVTNDHVFVCGSAADGEKGHFIYVYDTEGNLEQRLIEDGEDYGLGSVTYVFETDNLFVALDGNMRTIPVWSKDGTYLGRTEDSDLFGTRYPWFCNSTTGTDGVIYTVMTEERADKSADEILVYSLSVN